MTKDSVFRGVLIIAAAILGGACDPAPLPTQPELPNQRPISGIQVVGPDSLEAGDSAQFVANIQQPNGATKPGNGMPNLRWRSSNPTVAWVNTSGMVFTSRLGSGETVITAEITPSAEIQGTRRVVVRPRPKAVVTAELDIKQGTASDPYYVFTLELTESAGVAATVTFVWISLDTGWSGECSWTAAQLGEKRLPAKGTVSVGPLACAGWDASTAEVSVVLLDDKGSEVGASVYRNFVVR